jgi:hypothetical protein
MKTKFLNLVTLSVATSLLLAPAQKAFSYTVEPQTNIKETTQLLHDIGSSRGADREGTENQGLVQESKAKQSRQSHPAHPVAAASQTIAYNQPSSAEQAVQVSNTVGGVFITFLFSSYILLGLQYKRYRAHRAAVLLQQIEMLERIWRMKPQKR